MKKTLLFVLIGFFSFQSFAQDPDLLSNNWHFNNLTIDGIDYVPDFEDYFYFIKLNFDNDGIGADFKTNACEYLYADITYQNNTEFNLSNLSQSTYSCEPDFEDFKSLYFDFFYNNQQNSFTYEIFDNVGDKSLVITDFFGNKVSYNNEQPLHPFIIQSWYLTHLFHDLGDGDVLISNVDPPISPTITINENLEFTGYGSCNSFSGNFIFNDAVLTPVNFEQTTNTCENQEHSNIESEFFGYFKYEENLYYGYQEIGNNQYFYLFSNLQGFYIKFKNSPNLGSEKFIKNNTTIYPNPVSDQLFISSENTLIETISIYTLTGKKVIENVSQTNSIDVSMLSKGMYFIEISSATGKAIKKFIKK